MSDAPVLRHIDGLDLRFVPKVWPFAVERRSEIDVFFAEQVRRNPALWNGRVLMLYRYEVAAGMLRGEFLETDYASFSAWNAWGSPARDVWDCFGAAAIVGADGAVLLGVMAAHTFNAGHMYLPCGTPDPQDVRDGKVDIAFSVRRELKEETGLDPADFSPEPGWAMVTHGPLIALIKVLRSKESAVALRDRILAFTAGEKSPEISDILVVRSPADFDPKMRDFVKSFMAQRFAGG